MDHWCPGDGTGRVPASTMCAWIIDVQEVVLAGRTIYDVPAGTTCAWIVGIQEMVPAGQIIYDALAGTTCAWINGVKEVVPVTWGQEGSTRRLHPNHMAGWYYLYIHSQG